MDKIKKLLEQAKVSPELAQKITESLAKYKETLREQFDKEYAAKVEQVKKVCIDETENHKRELARRVQIFCETKGTAIEAHIAKQAAISESDALSKLKTVKAMLTGIALNEGPNGQTTAGLGQLKKRLQLATESKTKALEVANKQTAIAESVLKKNRELATENSKLKKQLTTISESKQSGQKLDQRKRPAKPRSTRPTIVENQDRRPPAKPKPQPAHAGTGFGINDIAGTMDEDLV